ncbi:MAG: SHOCT domain-containing protein [Candidatus Aquicultorales bacterium]
MEYLQYMDRWWYGGGWIWVMMLFMLAFWILVIAAIIFLFRWLALSGAGKPHVTRDAALEVLKERYARGEISKEEFERMKKELS